jgi:hypothetical protein
VLKIGKLKFNIHIVILLVYRNGAGACAGSLRWEPLLVAKS